MAKHCLCQLRPNSAFSHSRWYHAEVSVTADSVRLSVNHQPATEQSVGVDVVAMLERLTIGGGTASGKIY